jgi:hypothetical protein
MRADARGLGWQRWRELVFATCTAWLVVQNMVLLTLLAWSNPANAWAAGAKAARTALALGGPLCVVGFAVFVAFALAAALMHAPAAKTTHRNLEVDDDQRFR